ncbi:MAG TPA: hypothetical protein VM571_09725 [Noviherbaspirillum sp.]|nr:hypothetical protein [Noviherbaspirillum sp.]
MFSSTRLPHLASTSQVQTRHEESTSTSPAPTPAATPNEQVNPLKRPNSSTLEWVANRTKKTADVVAVRRVSSSQRNTGIDDFKRAGELLEHSEKLIGEVNDFLFGSTRASRKTGEKKFEELSKLLDEIRELTLKFDPDTPALYVQPRSTLSASTGKAVNSTIEKPLIDKCLDILNALPHLCNAMEWSKRPHRSLFDYHVTLDESHSLSPAELDNMLTHAALAHTVYAGVLENNLEKAGPLLVKTLPESFVSMTMPPDVKASFEKTCPRLQHLGDGRFCDPDSGLVGQLFVNESKKEATIAFGGTTAGPQKGSLAERMQSNAWITARQWRANISSASGLTIVGDAVPDSYSRAAELAGLMKNFAASKGPGWKVSLTGHSKGGAEAEYAALKNELTAVCFGTPELGKTVLAAASQSQLIAGARNIRHYFVKGDLAPQIGSLVSPLLGRRQAHVGTSFSMSPDPAVGNGILKSLWCHDLFYESALHEAARQLTHSDDQDEQPRQ